MKIKTGIIDDNHFLLGSFKEKLSFFEAISLKFAGSSGFALMERLAKNANLDILLMDIEMPEINGIDLTSQIKKKYPHIKIVMLTVFDHDDQVFKAIKAGADGYLLKDIEAERLHQAILETMNGGAPMTPVIARKALKLLRNPHFDPGLEKETEVIISTRETEVLEQLATGKSYNQIAENLFISAGTVRKHIENIYRKLEAHNKMEAIAAARSRNII